MARRSRNRKNRPVPREPMQRKPLGPPPFQFRREFTDLCDVYVPLQEMADLLKRSEQLWSQRRQQVAKAKLHLNAAGHFWEAQIKRLEEGFAQFVASASISKEFLENELFQSQALIETIERDLSLAEDESGQMRDTVSLLRSSVEYLDPDQIRAQWADFDRREVASAPGGTANPFPGTAQKRRDPANR